MKKKGHPQERHPGNNPSFYAKFYFKHLHYYTAIAVQHMGKNQVFKTNQSQTIKLRMPALGNRILSFSAQIMTAKVNSDILEDKFFWTQSSQHSQVHFNGLFNFHKGCNYCLF